MEYSTASHTNVKTFTDLCTKHMVDGWIPQGGVAVSYNDRSQSYLWAQAFTRVI